MARKKQIDMRMTIFFITVILIGMIIYRYRDETQVGAEIDNYKGVAVYYNGKSNENNYGDNYSADGYYYGEKWQCVEFVKRFYYEVKAHRMPDVFGNAKEYYDPAVPQGKLNHRRGLVQYRNGGNISPQVDDLLVFTGSRYGHAAIISSIGADNIEIVQQNAPGYSRQILPFTVQQEHYYIGTLNNKPAGWLRKEY